MNSVFVSNKNTGNKRNPSHHDSPMNALQGSTWECILLEGMLSMCYFKTSRKKSVLFCFDRVRPSVYDFLSSFPNLLPCGTEGDQDFDSNPVTTFCFIPRSPLTWSSSEMCGNLNDDIVSAVFHGFSSSVPNRA